MNSVTVTLKSVTAGDQFGPVISRRLTGVIEVPAYRELPGDGQRRPQIGHVHAEDIGRCFRQAAVRDAPAIEDLPLSGLRVHADLRGQGLIRLARPDQNGIQPFVMRLARLPRTGKLNYLRGAAAGHRPRP